MKKGLGTRGWGLGIKSPGLGIRDSGLGRLAAVGFLVILNTAQSGAHPARESAATGMRITVRLQDYAQVPRGTLAGAEKEATRILQDTGIAVTWLDCGGPAEDFRADPECAKPFAPTDLLLRILPRSMAEHVPFTDSTFGFALQSTDDQLGFAASVFCHRVEELAEKLGFSRAQILAYISAHEIGHLLLRSMVHSTSGIMRASLSREDLLRPLAFTDEQAELIRADVAARINLRKASRPLTATGPQ